MKALHARSGFAGWRRGGLAPERGTIVLGHRRVYIVPTGLGWLYAAMLAILLIGSINYALSLGFALTFLLAGTALAAMVHTVRNLAQLRIGVGRAEPAFAGGTALFRVYLESGTRYDRPSVLVLHVESGAQQVVDVPALGVAEPTLAVPAARRGRLSIGRVRLETRFPLGIFKAWSTAEPDALCLVYPAPLSSALPQVTPDHSYGAAQALNAGNEDFSGLRAYQASDSPRQVAWKAVARTDELHTKQFSGDSAAELWLDEALLPRAIDLEQRLSRLSGWVMAAEKSGMRYGLRLAGIEIAPGRGEAHRAACLQALALYRQP